MNCEPTGTAQKERGDVDASMLPKNDGESSRRADGEAIRKATMGAVLTRLLEVFYTKKLDIVVIGLENRCASMLLGYAWR